VLPSSSASITASFMTTAASFSFFLCEVFAGEATGKTSSSPTSCDELALALGLLRFFLSGPRTLTGPAPPPSAALRAGEVFAGLVGGGEGGASVGRDAKSREAEMKEGGAAGGGLVTSWRGAKRAERRERFRTLYASALMEGARANSHCTAFTEPPCEYTVMSPIVHENSASATSIFLWSFMSTCKLCPYLFIRLEHDEHVHSSAQTGQIVEVVSADDWAAVSAMFMPNTR